MGIKVGDSGHKSLKFIRNEPCSKIFAASGGGLRRRLQRAETKVFSHHVIEVLHLPGAGLDCWTHGAQKKTKQNKNRSTTQDGPDNRKGASVVVHSQSIDLQVQL